VRLKGDARFGARLDRLTQWNGQPVPEALRRRLAREWQKVELMTKQIHDLDRARQAMVRQSRDDAVALVRQLLELRGIGVNAAWLYVMEFFAWREFRNRRQVGGSTGLVGTPYQSGATGHEQGISKAGNRRVRAMAVQIAWGWLTYQRQSALTHWYHQRFAHGGPVARKIGIVAVARRLVIDLWRYLDAGVLPEGAVLKGH
jgi:transposase